MREQKYHLLRRRQADLRVLLRGLVCLYLSYLGGSLALQGGGELSQGLRLLIGGVFVLCAAIFGLYTCKQYRSDLRAAELTAEEREEAMKQEEE